MTTGQWVGALVGGLGGAYWALWWFLVREPPDRRDSVSAGWRDERDRGRRE
jgi:hypothetical protein